MGVGKETAKKMEAAGKGKGTFAKSYTAKLTEENVLGRGRFSIVYNCTEKKTGMKCAVKVMDLEELSDDEFAKIALESTICDMISGPQICKMVACFKEKTKHYLVYELLTGGELFDEIVKRADTGISELEVSSWMKQLLLGLKECHDKEIVHRDVKLENLMLVDETSSSAVKLADFGLAVIQETGPAKLGLAGSPAYIAPEVLKGRAYGKPVDMWSAGIAMYIMLSGAMPFEGDDDTQMFEAIKAGGFEYPEDEWSGVSASCKSLIDSLLNQAPDLRLDVDKALAHPWIADPEKHAKKKKRKGGSQRLKKRKGKYRPGRGNSKVPAWFVGPLNAESCSASVLAAGTGGFLIRQTPVGHRYIICCYDVDAKGKGICMNLPCEVTGDGTYRFGTAEFDSLEEIAKKFKSTALRGKSGANIFLKKAARDWMVEGMKDKKIKSDVVTCGPDSFIVTKDKKGVKYTLFIHDSAKVKKLVIKWVEKKGAFVHAKREFKSVDAWLQHVCELEPIKGRYGRMLRPRRPALPAKMNVVKKVVGMV